MSVPVGPASAWTLSGGKGRPIIRFKGRLIRFSFFDKRGNHIHYAGDIDADTGDDILSPNSGKVVSKGYEPNAFGHYIVVVDGYGSAWYFAHFRKASALKIGASVKAGQKLSECGCTGWCTGDHLHLERRTKRTPDRARYAVDSYCAVVWAVENLRKAPSHRNPYHVPPDPADGPNLRRGDIGEDVMWVEWSLKRPLRTIRGVFDAALEREVKAFQRKHFASAPGSIGPKTWAKLREVSR